jgi:hypothetical protein
MRFAAALFIRLLDKFPRFEVAAYLLVVVIGVKLLSDWAFNSDWSQWGWTGNRVMAHAYATWLQEHWPLSVAHPDEDHLHLLDFHDLNRPESILFWLAMVGTFCVGFLPRPGGPQAARRQ